MTTSRFPGPTRSEVSDPGGPAGNALTAPGFLPVLWRHKWALTVAAVVGVLLGVFLAQLQPTTYAAQSRIFYSSQNSFDPLGNDSFTADPTRYLEQQAALLTAEPVLERAVGSDETIGSVQEVRNSLTVSASREADIVTVQAAGGTAAQADARLEAVVDGYRAFLRSTVAAQTEALTTLSNGAERRLVEQRAALYGDGVQLVEPATTLEQSALVRNATVGGLVGLLLAMAWAVARSRRAAQPVAAGENSSAAATTGGSSLAVPTSSGSNGVPQRPTNGTTTHADGASADNWHWNATRKG